MDVVEAFLYVGCQTNEGLCDSFRDMAIAVKCARWITAMKELSLHRRDNLARNGSERASRVRLSLDHPAGFQPKQPVCRKNWHREQSCSSYLPHTRRETRLSSSFPGSDW